MTSPYLSTLLIDAPIGRHFAQLHRDPQDLVEAVGLFIGTGLRRGSGVVVIASASATALLLQHLSRTRLDVQACCRVHQLHVLDAEGVLAEVMRDDLPDWAAFRRSMESALETVRAFSRSGTRVYGEMVNLLWRAGRAPAAKRLERYWNDLARLHPFSLFCGYVLDGRSEDAEVELLHDIGRTHTDIIATDEDEPFRAALDEASQDIYGIPLSQILNGAGHEAAPGEHRLPSGRRTRLWMLRHKPPSRASGVRDARP
jgi:DcmR-like sensory protein